MPPDAAFGPRPHLRPDPWPALACYGAQAPITGASGNIGAIEPSTRPPAVGQSGPVVVATNLATNAGGRRYGADGMAACDAFRCGARDASLPARRATSMRA